MLCFFSSLWRENKSIWKLLKMYQTGSNHRIVNCSMYPSSISKCMHFYTSLKYILIISFCHVYSDTITWKRFFFLSLDIFCLNHLVLCCCSLVCKSLSMIFRNTKLPHSWNQFNNKHYNYLRKTTMIWRRGRIYVSMYIYCLMDVAVALVLDC